MRQLQRSTREIWSPNKPNLKVTDRDSLKSNCENLENSFMDCNHTGTLASLQKRRIAMLKVELLAI